MKTKAKKRAILPFDFTIDDVAALHVFLKANGLKFNKDGIDFYTYEMNCETPENEVYFIDCGPNDYKLRDCGSATEVICTDFDVEPDGALAKLLDVLKRNNQTGFLRQHGLSISFVMRSLSQNKQTKIVVLEEALKVIEIYFEITKRGVFNLEEAKRLIAGHEELSKLLDRMNKFLEKYYKGKKLDFHIFTLPWYMAARRILSDDIDEIFNEVDFWLTMFMMIEDRREAVRELIKEVRVYLSPGNKIHFCCIETDNPFVAEAIFKYPIDLVIMKSSTGNVVILTSRAIRFDMSVVARVLNERDKETCGMEIWYYNDRIEGVLNGSMRRPQLPTSLSLSEVTQVVLENFVIKE